MFRGDALTEAKGYDPAIMAGEEPELCHRLRGRGWRVWRIYSPMTILDADMHRPRQWWMRTVRSGFGYAQVWQKTRTGKGEPLYSRQPVSALFWTFGRSEEHTSELQSLMRLSYAVFCLKKKIT